MMLEVMKEIVVNTLKKIYISVNLIKYTYIKNFIEEFSEVHFKEYPSINQKIIFKFMDLKDEYDDEDESD